jgi:hypothetical protein
MTAATGRTTTGPAAIGIGIAIGIAMTTTAGRTGIMEDRIGITEDRIGITEDLTEVTVDPIAPAIAVGPIVAVGAAIVTTTRRT